MTLMILFCSIVCVASFYVSFRVYASDISLTHISYVSLVLLEIYSFLKTVFAGVLATILGTILSKKILERLESEEK